MVKDKDQTQSGRVVRGLRLSKLGSSGGDPWWEIHTTHLHQFPFPIRANIKGT